MSEEWVPTLGRWYAAGSGDRYICFLEKAKDEWSNDPVKYITLEDRLGGVYVCLSAEGSCSIPREFDSLDEAHQAIIDNFHGVLNDYDRD